MDVKCSHCHARHFKVEKVTYNNNSFNTCCNHGEVVLDSLPDPPQILKDLFNRSHELSNHFHDRVRCLNNAVAFASFNANLINFNSDNRRPGPYCFKIQGQIYYQMNTSLYPSAGELPSYGQLFIIDQNESTNIRCNTFSTLNREIVDAVGQALREYNTFAKSYQMMHEELQRLTIGTEEPEMQLLFTLKPGMDARRYNPQKVNEVAALFTTTADGDIPESYVTVHNKKSKNLQFISSMDPTVEPLVYPLFYPHGTLGWHSNIPCVNKNRRVTRATYIKYRIAVRDFDNVFLMGGRLFQQWIVDNYVKIEKDRMTFCRNNQKSIRADTYQGLIDHLQQQANSSNQQLGKMVVLPSSFTGSPRNMLQHYQDAMAIVRKFGKPDLFVTMSCNPNWREIQENLLPGQTSSDRPDIVSRVFNIKKEELITTIVKKKLFGETLAYVYVIEYQKRGLPHIHLLITLKSNHKIVTSDVVDKYISAEIPLLADDPILHNIVMKNMIHGPCGAWCKDQNGKCFKHFPKSFQNETIMDENGYPTYRRRNTGAHNRPQGGTADNQYVVPYNATLLKLFNCHINTEIVSSIKSVKYLYKYIYKGHDAAAVEVVDETSDIRELNHDEIRNYIETRYVGPVEACDRIMGRSLQKKVIQL